MTISLKNIDPKFAWAVKSAAYGEGMTLKEFFLMAVARLIAQLQQAQEESRNLASGARLGPKRAPQANFCLSGCFSKPQ